MLHAPAQVMQELNLFIAWILTQGAGESLSGLGIKSTLKLGLAGQAVRLRRIRAV